ncbi:MAG: PH domain-containing protein [Pleurocapsa sp.]
MFKKIAADAFGLSDIGIIIQPQDYDKVESDDFVLHEEKEKIFFLIKSKTDEYCFTNKALIHVDGTSAVSKKRTLKRLDYSKYVIQDVVLETAGTIDLDIEIKFAIGSYNYSIDVHKKHIEQLKDLYKALIKISYIQSKNTKYLEYAHASLKLASKSVNRSTTARTIEQEFKTISQYAFEWLTHVHETYTPHDFSSVFETFIQH